MRPTSRVWNNVTRLPEYNFRIESSWKSLQILIVMYHACSSIFCVQPPFKGNAYSFSILYNGWMLVRAFIRLDFPNHAPQDRPPVTARQFMKSILGIDYG